MFLLQQLIQLLSEPPGSMVYHLVTLFAIQVVFAIGYTQYRRNREDDQALRTAWAAGVIFVGQLVLLAIGLTAPQAIGMLPPLEQALNTATIVLLLWALIPPPAASPRLSDMLVVSALVITAVMYLFFAQAWQAEVTQGSRQVYNTSAQAGIWHVIQIVLLAAGLLLTLLRADTRRSLRPFIIGLLLLAHIAQSMNEPAYLLNATSVPFWARLGQLVAFPLWAAFAYQQSLSPLLDTRTQYARQSRRFATVLDAIGHMLTLPDAQRPAAALGLVQTLLPEAGWVAVGQFDSNTAGMLTCVARDGSGHGREFTLTLAEWPRLQTALAQQTGQAFVGEGIGARDWHQFYATTGLEPQGPLLAEPLLAGEPVGLLMIGGPEALDAWPETDRLLASGVAQLLAIALTGGTPVAEAQPPAELAQLRAERDALQVELHTARASADQAEQQLAAMRKETQALSASLAAIEAYLRSQEDA